MDKISEVCYVQYGTSVVKKGKVADFLRENGLFSNLPDGFWQKNYAGWGRMCFHEESRIKAVADYDARKGNDQNQVADVNKVPQMSHLVFTKDSPTQDKPSTIEIAGVDSSGIQFSRDAFTPKADPTFTPFGEFRTIDQMIKSEKFFTLYITGDSGCGKNMMIQQAAANANRPMVRVNFNRDVTEENLIGTKTLKDGNVLAEDGPVTWAAENGAVLVLDELSMSDANKIMCLQNPLEGKPFFAKHANRIVTPKPGFCIIATDNTKGKGDSSGRFVGANVLNSAFLERFMFTIEHEYPSKKVELQILKTASQVYGFYDEEFVTKLVDLVHVVRNTYNDEGLEDHITTRRAVVILKGYIDFFRKDPRKAIELSLNRFDDTTRDAIMILWDKISQGEDVGQTKNEIVHEDADEPEEV